MPPRKDQIAVPCAYVRGGSSKALFFHEHDIPAPGPDRDRFLKRAMGTPDPIQIDGMGGAKAVTSKIAIVRRSQRHDADIDYLFVQAGVRDDLIDYSANCGNISSGVGPFAIDEGLLSDAEFRLGRGPDPKVKAREVRIFNTGTEKTLISHVPVDGNGYSVAQGEYTMAAVPGSGAPILMDYRETVGASRNLGLLPTGNPRDRIELQGREIEISVCDVANIIVFVHAAELGISGHETAEKLSEDGGLLERVREVRGRAARLVGMCGDDWRLVDQQSPFMPMLVALAPAAALPPAQHANAHVVCRLFLDNMCHPSMAGTGSCCTAACSRVKGSLVYDIVAPEARKQNVLNILHPLGIIPIACEQEPHTVDTTEPEFGTLSFIRTSRRIMDGQVYVPRAIFDEDWQRQTKPYTNGHGRTNGANGLH